MPRLFFHALTLVVAFLAVSGHSEGPPKAKEAATEKALNEPERVIRCNDSVRITLIFPGRKIGSLEKVQPNGEVATPEGSFVKADGLSIGAFKASLLELYKEAPGYEEAQVEIRIASSPYAVVKMDATKTVSPEQSAKPSPPTVYPRCFKTPLTVWQAIQQEGGIPSGVDPHSIHVLKANLARKKLDCSGKDGAPDGDTPVESGDYIFLVPDDVPVSKIFE